MATVPLYQVDAFASRPFEGNQACVMPLQGGYPDDATLQAIAAENNVAETAFLVAEGEGTWQLRWFTPATEVPLCGHATLAAAHVLFAHEGFAGDTVRFRTRQSGELRVCREAHGYVMDFPAAQVFETRASDEIAAALGARPVRAWGGPFFAAQFDTPETVGALSPDLAALAGLGVSGQGGSWACGHFGCFALGGDGFDVTSRFFAPGSGIDEDPATGSWHCMLAVIADQLTGHSEHDCFQAFPGRGARIGVRLEGERVKLEGRAVTVIEGRFTF
ncbi:MAG: PhzF family phenazine biosynthesis isomerase [Alphaproteobacteria bacterium]|jgi:PhzF family phenazine biosynthesis protein|nr:PhzF family phenazine biosynthesis isomerase [Alphaproteobacteria bacterium]